MKLLAHLSKPLVRYKSPASSVVDRVLLTANETDQFLVKVMVRQCRRPEVGDKYTRGSVLKEMKSYSSAGLLVAMGKRGCVAR